MHTSSRSSAAFMLSDLPRRGDRDAPRWDGNPLTLQDFLDDFEDMCRRYRVPQERVCDALLRLAPSYDTRAFWKCIVSDIAADAPWHGCRKALVEFTPGANDDRRYTRADLEEVVSQYQAQSYLSIDDFSRLWTRFCAISEFLLSHGRLSEAERSEKLLECLPIPLQTRVKAQIRRQYPRHHAEDPLPLKVAYDIIMFVLSIGQECFEDEPVPRTQKRSSIEQNHLERRAQRSDSLMESTRELSSAVEKLSYALENFAAGPRKMNRDTKAIANSKPTLLPQSFPLHQDISESQSQGSSESSLSIPQEASQNDTDSEEWEDDDIPFVEATLFNQVRCVHRARELLKSARPRSAIGTESIVNSNLGSQVRRNSSASVNLVANYVGTVSKETIEHQQEPTTQSPHHSLVNTPDTSHTPSSPRNVYAEANTLDLIVSEQQVRPEQNEEIAISVSEELRTVDSKARQIVQDDSAYSQRDLVDSFVAVVPRIGPPSLSSIELQPAFKIGIGTTEPPQNSPAHFASLQRTLWAFRAADYGSEIGVKDMRVKIEAATDGDSLT
ncbi:hypothetical protein NMY22_g1885 [Coprinellus aureogranulatus]|nr:hypothetical protein NMY22_g1885 [Coprinellus aureogranulatus]